MAKRNSKKEERKRRLLFLILLFILTLGIGGTATYAWFTSNRTVTVEQIDVEVSAVNGLQISADAENWKAKVQKDELTAGYKNTSGTTISTNQIPDIFGAVSTVGAVSSGKLQMFDGTVAAIAEGQPNAGQYALTTATAAAEVQCTGAADGCASRHYAAFDIFLKVDQDTEVVLDDVANVTTLGGSEPDKGVQNAARVAFVVEGHTAPGALPTDSRALSGGTEAIIWEPNMDMHTATGAQNGSSVYGLSGNNIKTGGGATQISYDGVKAAFTAPILLNQATKTANGTYFDTVNVAIATAGTRSAAEDLFTNTKKLQAGVTKVRIYWWIEGQDIDAENNATGSKMRLKLSFSIK